MANLSYTEKRNLEEFLQMAGGYVLDFSNRAFQVFVYDSVRLNIDDETLGGFGSKAVRLRHFWLQQPDHIVGKLLKDFVDYRDLDSPLREKCRKIVARLLQSAPVHDAEVIAVLSRREEFERVASGVREAIEKNDPESGLDRLHTFAVKFTRSLCEKHGIAIERDKPAPALCVSRWVFHHLQRGQVSR